MAIKTKDSLIESIKNTLGDDMSDDALAVLEDITDTLDDYETRVSDTTDWKSKYDENDSMWRKKYRDRFFSPQDDPDPEPEPEPSKKITRFEELFTVKEN